jgi:hypothetical protein|tara:strand:+ start:371 stop:643 length:273 start_codon:yes stop_codon:yes gene_type:complete
MGGASSEVPLLRELSLSYLVDNVDILGRKTAPARALMKRVQSFAVLRRGVQARLKERSSARKAVEAESAEKEKAKCVICPKEREREKGER